MWIRSSPCKNRVSDRGRIDVFSQRSISAVKASLLLLALASFSISAASESCEGPEDGICFATSKDDLKDGRSDYIDIKGDKITWHTSKSQRDSKIVLYTLKCGKLSFSMSKPDNLGDDCKFSMLYGDECDMDIVWKKDDRLKKVDLKFYYKDAYAGMVGLVSEANVDLDGANLTCKSKKKNPVTGEGFCLFKTSKVGDWCSFMFAFSNTGSCDSIIQFDADYKLGFLAPTTVAPKLTTTPGGDAAGLSPWIIAGIVVGVLILVAVGVGLLVFFLIRRRNRLKSQNAGPKILTGARTFYVPATKKRNESPTYQDDEIKTQMTNTTERLEIEMGLPVEKNRQNKNIPD